MLISTFEPSFATLVIFMDMQFIRRDGPSFVRLQGNVRLSVPSSEIKYTYLCSDGATRINANTYRGVFAGINLTN